MDEDAFLRDIRADPDDPGPRLVFADWLEERGDPRAEFIRLDCELADPGLDDAARRGLISTHRALLGEQRKRCLARLKALGVRDIRFWCGLVDRLLIEGTAFLDRPRTLFQVAPAIRGLMLRKIPPDVVSDAMRRLFKLPQLTCLSSLDVAGCGLASGGAEALADSDRSRGLIHLNVSHNFLGGQGLRNLALSAHLTQLVRLNLGDNQLGVSDVRELTRSTVLRQLEDLVLAANRLGDAGIRRLCQAQNMSGLRVLDLSRNDIGTEGLKAWAESPRVLELHSLDLSGNPLGDVAGAVLASSSNSSCLHTLNLAGCHLGAEGCRAVLASPYLQRLVELNLSGNELGSGVLDPRAFRLPSLRSLELADNDLQAADVACLASSSALQLSRLDLTGNAVGDSGVRSLTLWQAATGLRVLRLANSGIGDDGVRTLLQSALFDGLEILDLRDNQITMKSELARRFAARVQC